MSCIEKKVGFFVTYVFFYSTLIFLLKSGKGYFKVFSRKVFFKRLNEFKRDIRNQERKSEVDL